MSKASSKMSIVFFSLPGNRLNTGSRRNFVVRMKCGSYEGDDDESNMRITEIKNRCKDKRIVYTDESYAVVHCTGYIRVRVLYEMHFDM